MACTAVILGQHTPVFQANKDQDELKWVNGIGVCSHFCWETQKQQLLHRSIQQQMRQFSAAVHQYSFVARAFQPEPPSQTAAF